MNHLTKIIAFGMLLFAIGFNLWLYRLEPTAMLDPNDNTFQYALVDRTNQIWNYASDHCTKNLSLVTCYMSLLVDHWVPNWAQGYNLPTYYSHVPQILIVGSYRLSNFIRSFLAVYPELAEGQGTTLQNFSLFQYYHIVIYLLLCLFPLSVFLALRVLRLPWLVAGIGALLASHLSTDGLYGLDPASFLWRGYGLSSQLFAMIPLPLALAYSWRYFNDPHQGRFGRQFLTELVSRLSNFIKNPLRAGHHLVRNGKSIYDQNKVSRTSVKNSSAGLSQLSADSLVSIKRSFLPAVFFLIATISGHLGVGIIAVMSLIPFALAPVFSFMLNRSNENVLLSHGDIAKNQNVFLQQCINVAIQQLKKLFLLAGTTIFFLSYWIIPVLLNDNYHNISFWDPPWKFNSYGAKEIMIRLFNGDLFDFGRLPILTFLGISGVFACLSPKKESREQYLVSREKEKNVMAHFLNTEFQILSPFALLFVFWLLLYFGRGTWGGLIDLIPGMKEFHLSRFIVGLHAAGLFLIPIGLWWLAEKVARLTLQLCSIFISHMPKNVSSIFNSFIRLFVYSLICLLIIVPVYSQTIRYNDLNNTLIREANANYAKVKTDTDLLITELKTRMINSPGRVYFGRGGNWGKDFKVAETPYYIHFSTYGIPTVLWLPQTWSPNSDIEQYFTEENQSHYDLFGIRYVVTPPAVKPLSFWKFIKETASWKLYEVASPTPGVKGIRTSGVNISGYITTGIRPAIVSSDKRSYANVIRLWIQTDKTHEIGLYPEFTFAKDYPRKTGLPNFRMLNEATYQIPDDSIHNLFREPPLYLPPGATSSGTLVPFNTPTILSQSMESDMAYKAKVRVPDPCTECIVVLKQSGNPNWKVTIDGKEVDHFNVFPVFVAVSVPPGDHDIIFSYEPSKLKIFLLLLSVTVAFLLVVIKLASPAHGEAS